MSEKLLKALMQLFAIVAKEGGVSSEERTVVEAFLRSQLNQDAVIEYMKLFEEHVLSYAPKTDKDKGPVRRSPMASVKESARTLRICTQINKELTQKQKFVVVYRLMELIMADEEITEQENEFITTVYQTFNIPVEEYSSIREFVINKVDEKLDLPNILIIDAHEKNAGKARKHICNSGISGFVAFLRIPSVEMYLVKYCGESNVYLNGIGLNFNQVYTFANGSTIRFTKINPVYYSDIVSRFLREEAATRTTFEAVDIEFTFPAGNIGLRGVNIAEESGKLIGLMGASGAGKTTLLSVLNGNEIPSKGRVLINGIDIHKQKKMIEGVIGYVPQDDLLIEDLSVYQNLYFAAKLCFKDYSEIEIEKLVLKTLMNLGLIETKNLKVGSPLKKTISGGQRKRINIGLELLREPSVLFLDEPTSGLSSRDSENILDLLKELSLRGKLIFVVIHQPSSEIFKMFDKLMILDVGGYPVYYGNPVEAVIYFKSLANQINAEQGECMVCGNVNPEQIFNIIETKVVDEYGNFTEKRKVIPQQWNGYFKEKIKIPVITTSTEKAPGSLNIPTKLKQLLLFIKRDVLSKLSNTQYLTINLMEAPLLAIILAGIVKYTNLDESVSMKYIFSQNENMTAYMFMSIIVALFMGLTVSAEEIIRDRKILKRESFLNLSKTSYLLSKVSILFTLSAIQSFTFVLIGNMILGINGMLLTYWLVLFSTFCFANMLGLNISATFNSAVTIYILIPILLIPQLILSGVIVKFDKLNPWLASVDKVPIVGEMMASRWAFEALAVSQFKDNEYEKIFYDLEKEMGMAEYKKAYLIPKLMGKVEYCLNHIGDKDKDVIELYKKELTILKSEIIKETERNFNLKFDLISELEPGKFNDKIALQTKEYLGVLKKYYIKRNNLATGLKDDKVAQYIDSPKKKEIYNKFRNSYFNESLSDLVKASNEGDRIIEKDGKLIQRIYPIFQDPANNGGLLQFRSHFYSPNKYMFNQLIDTKMVNVIIIWLMSITLYATLYYDFLKRLMDFFGGLVDKVSGKKWK